MEVQIPEGWKHDVCALLHEGDADKVIVRFTSALQPFMDAFPSSYPFDLHNAIRESLSQTNVTGRLITDMDEPGEVYAFWFFHQKRKLYGKICLSPDKQSLIIYSAHVPRKGDTL